MEWNFNLDECPDNIQVLFFKKVNVNGFNIGENFLGVKVRGRFFLTINENDYYTNNRGHIMAYDYEDDDFDIEKIESFEIESVDAFCIIPQIEKKD